MIVVIADDMTGAAELGGIGLRYGLRVLIAADIIPNKDTELLVVYTNARSLSKNEAVKVMAGLTKKAKALSPVLFYKKTDSVLRGHVLAEMQAQMAVLDAEKGLLVPVNPSLGRTIKDGHYFINGELVHETSFSTDPEFPVRSSKVKEMVEEEGISVKLVTRETEWIGSGIAIGEAQTAEDVAFWAEHKCRNILYAGGASFFDALLRTMYEKKSAKQTVTLTSPLLLVSGTTFQKNRDHIKSLAHLTSYMPDELIWNKTSSANELEVWSSEITSRLQKEGRLVVAIGDTNKKANAGLLRNKTGEVIKKIFQKTVVHELLIEGGSTAHTIIQKLGWHSFVPKEELALGVVRMEVEGRSDLHLTIKPGSYEWPAEWKLDK
jgi:uncharacterized protein YgbK (DUF1537 family)